MRLRPGSRSAPLQPDEAGDIRSWLAPCRHLPFERWFRSASRRRIGEGVITACLVVDQSPADIADEHPEAARRFAIPAWGLPLKDMFYAYDGLTCDPI